MWTRRTSVSLQGRQIHLCGNTAIQPVEGHEEQTGFPHRERSTLPLISSAHLALQDIFTADTTIFFFINCVNAGCEEAGEGSETQITITSHLCACVIRQSDDVIIEAESSLSASEEEEEAEEEAGDSENDIRQLKARRHALANKLAQQQKRKDKIQVNLLMGSEQEDSRSFFVSFFPYIKRVRLFNCVHARVCVRCRRSCRQGGRWSWKCGLCFWFRTPTDSLITWGG